jgi:hypothetical protein
VRRRFGRLALRRRVAHTRASQQLRQLIRLGALLAAGRVLVGVGARCEAAPRARERPWEHKTRGRRSGATARRARKHRARVCNAQCAPLPRAPSEAWASCGSECVVEAPSSRVAMARAASARAARRGWDAARAKGEGAATPSER